MKGLSFFTALLRDEANCFISLRFPVALQLVADLQIPPSLTATFYTPFLEIDASLICLCGCFLILNLEMIFFSRKNSFQKRPSLGLWFREQPCKPLGLPSSRACSLPWWTMNVWGKQGSLRVDLLVVIAQNCSPKDRHMHLCGSGNTKQKWLDILQQSHFSSIIPCVIAQIHALDNKEVK